MPPTWCCKLDNVSPQTRSRIMRGIRGKNTQPEHFIRRGLHSLGFRFRIHRRDLPGTPDIVFPKYKAVILVQGCFWHGHSCHLFRWPKNRRDWWRNKIEKNRMRDDINRKALEQSGWRILEIWECALRGRERLPENIAIEAAAHWLRNGNKRGVIRGSQPN